MHNRLNRLPPVMWFVMCITDVISHASAEKEEVGTTGSSPLSTLFQDAICVLIGVVVAYFALPVLITATSPWMLAFALLLTFLIGTLLSSGEKTISYLLRDVFAGAFFYQLYYLTIFFH